MSEHNNDTPEHNDTPEQSNVDKQHDRWAERYGLWNDATRAAFAAGYASGYADGYADAEVDLLSGTRTKP